jgi:hypothetical protein
MLEIVDHAGTSSLRVSSRTPIGRSRVDSRRITAETKADHAAREIPILRQAVTPQPEHAGLLACGTTSLYECRERVIVIECA